MMSSPMPAGGAGQLDWLLDDLVRRVGQVSKAVILSQDGMALGASSALGRDDAEHLAALAAGFQSLARGATKYFGGGAVRQTIIEMEAGFLLVSAAGSGTCLAVIAEQGADLGLVAYEMAVLVRRSGEHIRVSTRSSAPPSSAPPSSAPPSSAPPSSAPPSSALSGWG